MKLKKVGILGANGRMGHEVAAVLIQSKNHRLNEGEEDSKPLFCFVFTEFRSSKKM